MSSSVVIQNVGSFCLDEVNFTVFTTPPSNQFATVRDEISQQQAIEECATFDNFSLGPIFNEKEFLSVKSFIETNEILFPFNKTVENHRLSFYIGLEAKLGQPPGARDTTVFSFVQDEFNEDEDSLLFYHVSAGSFPWKNNEPNNAEGVQDCSHLLYLRVQRDIGVVLNVDGEVDDIGCSEGRGFICRGTCFVENDVEEEGVNEDKNVVSFFFFGLAGFFFLIALLLIHSYINQRRKLKSLQKALLT